MGSQRASQRVHIRATHRKVCTPAARSCVRASLRARAGQVCAHPYLFLDRLQPPYAPADPAELVRASGKLALLDAALPKLRAAGHRVLLFSQARPAALATLRAGRWVQYNSRGALAQA
jgi:hypothetical protein